MDDFPDHFDDIARAIGRVCLKWSSIEITIQAIVLELACYQAEAYDDQAVSHPMVVLLSHMKLRERILAARALAHAVDEPTRWRDRLGGVLTTIDGTLTLERNRFVHDLWMQDFPSGISRFSSGYKVTKVQARTPALQMGTMKTYADMGEVEAAIEQIEATSNLLSDLYNELRDLTLQKRQR